MYKLVTIFPQKMSDTQYLPFRKIKLITSNYSSFNEIVTMDLYQLSWEFWHMI